MYAEEVVLPREDAQAFDKLHQGVRRDLKPSGYLQEQKVFDVAKELWRKQSLAIGYVLPFYKKQITPELMEAAKGGIANLAVYLADHESIKEIGLLHPIVIRRDGRLIAGERRSAPPLKGSKVTKQNACPAEDEPFPFCFAHRRFFRSESRQRKMNATAQTNMIWLEIAFASGIAPQEKFRFRVK